MKSEAQNMKQKAIDLLKQKYDNQHRKRLADIDWRLAEYFDHIISHSSIEPDDENDVHNVYEILGALRFLRLFDTYSFNKKKVQKVIRLREGIWKKENGQWHYVEGGLKCPGTSGDKIYLWQPFQVFVLACTFGFYSWVNTEMPADSKNELLPTERVHDGWIWDYRRLCTHFTYFGPRKPIKRGYQHTSNLFSSFLRMQTLNVIARPTD